MNDSAELPKPRRQLFCSKPFEFLEVGTHPGRGEAYLCCPAWVPKSIGNLRTSSVEEVWNGEGARSIRRSILDGSFRHCTRHCPFLGTVTGPVQELANVTDPFHLGILAARSESLSRGPRIVNAAFDRSCNLSCPSCRTRKIIERNERDEILELQETIERSALTDADLLYITGSGDAFGSPYFFSWLRSFDPTPFPRLRLHLITNGQLWTAQRWLKIPPEVRRRIETCDISIDAATESTYRVNRRGGDWGVLMNNLDFVSRLRREGDLSDVKISMVVQENNFQEMPEFVRLGKSRSFDQVYFRHLVDWGTFTPAELARRSVHLESHPRHGELLEVLADQCLNDPMVHLGALVDLLPSTTRDLRNDAA